MQINYSFPSTFYTCLHFLIIVIFYISFSLVFLHFHKDAKHLYLRSGFSTLTLMSPGMRVRWTIKGIGYLQQLGHTHMPTNVHGARPAAQQRAKEAPVYRLTEGARYCHEGSWPSEGAGDGVGKITAKTSVSRELRLLALVLGPERKREQCAANKGVGARRKRKGELHKVH